MFQMLSQGPGCWGWGGTAGNADMFPLSIDSCVLLEQEGTETVLAIVPTLVTVLIRTVSLIGINLGGRNISPKLGLLFKESQTVSFLPLFLQGFSSPAAFWWVRSTSGEILSSCRRATSHGRVEPATSWSHSRTDHSSELCRSSFRHFSEIPRAPSP